MDMSIPEALTIISYCGCNYNRRTCLFVKVQQQYDRRSAIPVPEVHSLLCEDLVPGELVPFFSSCVSWFSLGTVSSSSSASQMASGISLVSFNSRPDGMHQRSYSVSSADQWSEATVIANSGVSTGTPSRLSTTHSLRRQCILVKPGRRRYDDKTAQLFLLSCQLFRKPLNVLVCLLLIAMPSSNAALTVDQSNGPSLHHIINGTFIQQCYLSARASVSVHGALYYNQSAVWETSANGSRLRDLVTRAHFCQLSLL